MGRFEDAVNDFNRGLDLEPENTWLLANRGESYRRMARYEEALTDFNHALEMEPEDASALAGRGVVYRQIGRYEEALANFNQVEKFEPNRDWNCFNRGITYATIGREDQARDNLQIALQMALKKYAENPQDWCNTFNIALYNVASGELTRAQKYYLEVLDAGGFLFHYSGGFIGPGRLFGIIP